MPTVVVSSTELLPLFAQTVTTIASQVGIDDDLIQAPDGSLIGPITTVPLCAD